MIPPHLALSAKLLILNATQTDECRAFIVVKPFCKEREDVVGVL